MYLRKKAPLVYFRLQKVFYRPLCLELGSQIKGFYKPFLLSPYRSTSTLKNVEISKILSNQLEDASFYQSLQHGSFLDDLNSSDLSLVAERFQLKGLNVDYFYEYGVKVTGDLFSLLFPFDSIEKEFSAIQSMRYRKETKSVTTLFTSFKSSSNYLFGWSGVNTDEKKEIVIVSDPLDAIAVNQEAGFPAVSLSSDVIQLSSELIDPFKSFQKVILWLKQEQISPEVISLLSQSLGKHVFLVRPQDYPSGALACLQSGIKIKQILREAESIYHEGVDKLSPYRMILLDRFKNREKYSGLKWKRFSALNDILKGHRKGELTVFSGQTGTGKTTFVSEYSLDLCIQGLPTMWASFEIANERLLETMFCQYTQCSFSDNMEKFHHWFDEFEKLPMYVLNIRGRKSLKEMFQAMRLYVRVYNVQHVVIDNLQFLMNIESFNSAADQYRKQDEIFGAFRGFATQCACHVTLVIHPRKEPEFTELNNASISGTSKATQEADNILILQNTKTKQYIHITKNRFAGTKGCVAVEFNKDNYTFKQIKISNTLPPVGVTGQKKVL